MINTAYTIQTYQPANPRRTTQSTNRIYFGQNGESDFDREKLFKYLAGIKEDTSFLANGSVLIGDNVAVWMLKREGQKIDYQRQSNVIQIEGKLDLDKKTWESFAYKALGHSKSETTKDLEEQEIFGLFEDNRWIEESKLIDKF